MSILALVRACGSLLLDLCAITHRSVPPSLSHAPPMPPFVRTRRRYIKGEFVGGCDILTTMFKEGDLQKLLKEKNVAMEE